MLHVIEIPGDRLASDDELMDSIEGRVDWVRRCKVDDEGLAWRLDPVFESAADCVAWLHEAEAILDQRPDRGETLGPVLSLDGGATLPSLLSQYKSAFTQDGVATPGRLYRGEQETGRISLPTLLRLAWLTDTEDTDLRAEAEAALHAEQMTTHRFTSTFFDDFGVRSLFPEVSRMSIPLRAAIARHYGFLSWFLDFTVEAEIAAYFATGGGEVHRPFEGRGCISVIDESELQLRFQTNPSIEGHRGYQSRGWYGIPLERLRENYTLGPLAPGLDALAPPKFWKSMNESPSMKGGLSVRSFYTPGPDVERMWRQRWCGFENDNVFATADAAERMNCLVVFERMWGHFLFEHTGAVHESPTRGVTQASLFPSDLFTRCVENFKHSEGLTPGAHAKACFDKFKPAVEP